MLPGKTFKPDDLDRIVRKRIWWILVPFAVVSAVTAAVVRQLPDEYRSQALILVIPQRVPTTIVPQTVTVRLDERLLAINQEILSRTNLQKLIEEFDLYSKERQEGAIMDDVVTGMRGRIFVEPKRGDAFQITYFGDSPRPVQAVTARLATLFINENERSREMLAEGTYQFLDTALAEARRKLIEHENLVKEFNDKYRGQLPTQVSSNLQSAQNSVMQLQAVTSSIQTDNMQKRALEQQLKDAEVAPIADPLPPGAGFDASGRPVGGTFSQQLALAREELNKLQLRYTDSHREVSKMKAIVQDLIPKAQAEELARPVSEAGVSTAEATRRKRINDLKNAIDQIDSQIADKLNQEKGLRTNAATFQARAEAGPARDVEFTDLNRDYGVLQNSYRSLLVKKDDALLAANLERRNIGEQFKLLDQANLPQRPSSPNRPMITLFGLIGGLSLGLLFVAFREFRDGSFKTDEEVFRVLNLPVLAVVPLMRSTADSRRQFRKQLIVGAICGSTVVVCLGVVAWTLVA